MAIGEHHIAPLTQVSVKKRDKGILLILPISHRLQSVLKGLRNREASQRLPKCRKSDQNPFVQGPTMQNPDRHGFLSNSIGSCNFWTLPFLAPSCVSRFPHLTPCGPVRRPDGGSKRMQQLKEALIAQVLGWHLSGGCGKLDCHARKPGKIVALLHHQVRVSGVESLNSLQV